MSAKIDRRTCMAAGATTLVLLVVAYYFAVNVTTEPRATARLTAWPFWSLTQHRRGASTNAAMAVAYESMSTRASMTQRPMTGVSALAPTAQIKVPVTQRAIRHISSPTPAWYAGCQDRQLSGKSPPLVVGVMITGKDRLHHQLALLAIESFFNQTYPAKALVIVNDGQYRLHKEVAADHRPCVLEIGLQPDPKRLLGELRNIGSQAVPVGMTWVQWDDDDWRHPSLLARQMACLQSVPPPAAAFLRQQMQFHLVHNATRCFRPNPPPHSSLPRHVAGTVMTTKIGVLSEISYLNAAKAEDMGFARGLAKVAHVTNCSSIPA